MYLNHSNGPTSPQQSGLLIPSDSNTSVLQRRQHGQWGKRDGTENVMTLVARKIRANRFVRIDLRESFAIETPIFIARQADSPDSPDSCESIRANHATKVMTDMPPDACWVLS